MDDDRSLANLYRQFLESEFTLKTGFDDLPEPDESGFGGLFHDLNLSPTYVEMRSYSKFVPRFHDRRLLTIEVGTEEV